MGHVVLLSDSAFDNASHLGHGEPDVVAQLRARLPAAAGWRATLRAVDGAVTDEVGLQLDRLPPDASHLVVSVGGNDALGHAEVLGEEVRTVAEALARIAGIGARFRRRYRAMLGAVLARGLPTAVCTIYDARLPDPRQRALAAAALTAFNDVITREAFARGLPLIDLRLVCDRDEDYANPIEPSARGGEKIAAAIADLLARHDFARRRSEVFGGEGGDGRG